MKIIKNKSHMISSSVKLISFVCSIYLIALTNANAAPHKKNSKQAKKKSKPKVQLSFIPEKRKKTPKRRHNIKALNLTLKTKKKKAKTYIDFKKMKPTPKIKRMKEKYLTIYSRKKKNVKATYLQGAYAINYTQKW